MISILRFTFVVAGLVVIAQPASAQWTQVGQVPDVPLYSVWANGDTIVTTADSTIYVSTNAGATWKGSAKIAPGLESIRAARMRNGRLYVGTQRKGVFVSDNLGDSWSNFNQGLVGGFLDSQLIVADLLIRDDSMYVATVGSGAWVRRLSSGTWQRFGNIFEPEQASNMTFVAAGPSRLLAGGGNNGFVFFRFPGQPDWTPSFLLNGQIAPGLAPLSGIWSGTRWVVGASNGVFVGDESGWTFVDPGVARPFFLVPLAMHGGDLLADFAAGFVSVIKVSHDQGGSWQDLDTFPVPISKLAVLGNTLYASTFTGLWRRPLDDVASVPPPPARLSFAIVGAQPVRDVVRFRFDLPAPGPAAIHVFDLAGRRVGAAIDEIYAAGLNEVAWDAQALPPGVYHARLNAGSRTETVRLVRAR